MMGLMEMLRVYIFEKLGMCEWVDWVLCGSLSGRIVSNGRKGVMDGVWNAVLTLFTAT